MVPANDVQQAQILFAVGWSNLDNMKTPAGGATSVTLQPGEGTYELVVGYDLAGLPETAVVLGLVVGLSLRASAAGIDCATFRFYCTAYLNNDRHEELQDVPVSAAFYGAAIGEASSRLAWGADVAALTTADIRSADFKFTTTFGNAADGAADALLELDYNWIEVYYE